MSYHRSAQSWAAADDSQASRVRGFIGPSLPPLKPPLQLDADCRFPVPWFLARYIDNLPEDRDEIGFCTSPGS
jgi:hypothetical protein